MNAIGATQALDALEQAWRSTDFARPSALIESFEQEWADYCGVRFAVATSSGSSALLLAYAALGLGTRDEILTVPNTFVATAEAALMLGADVTLVDVDPTTLAMDEDLAIQALSERTRAVVPLHPFGRFTELPRLRAACAAAGIRYIEEACHAHGAMARGVRTGAYGDLAVFSFGPTKPLAGLGEGGAVVTDDPELARALREFNNHGRRQGEHAAMGLNFRMHPLEASYLSHRLRLYPDLLARRQEIAGRYNQAFEPMGIVANTAVVDSAEHSYYVYVVDVERRDAFCQHLDERGIGWDVHYPVAIHRQAAHRSRFGSAVLPRTDHAQTRILSLPLYDGLTDEEVDQVCSVVTEYWRS